MKKYFSIMMALAMVAMLFTGCSSQQPQTKLEQIKSANQLVLYTNANFPPFEYRKGAEVAGVDINLAKAIADEIGVELKVEDADFEGIIASLASGRGDIGISGFTIIESRKKDVDFSAPYIKSTQYLILPKDSQLSTMEDLAGKKVGAALGYTGQFVIKDEIKKGVLKDKNSETIIVNNALDGSLDIVNKRLDAVIMDEYVAIKIASENDQLKAIKLTYANGEEVSEEYGVAIPKGNQELVDIINKVIEKLKQDKKIEQWVIDNS